LPESVAVLAGMTMVTSPLPRAPAKIPLLDGDSA
jgi:hypothetical protein